MRTIKNALLSIHPITKENKREAKKYVIGGILKKNKIAKRLERISANDQLVSSLFGFFKAEGGKLRPRSFYSMALKVWVKEQTDNRKKYLS